MKYYKITCGTPFVGEENDYYIATDDKKELDTFIDECVYENGLEWCDDYELEMHNMTEEEYFAECGLVNLIEISKEEFLEACPWENNEREEKKIMSVYTMYPVIEVGVLEHELKIQFDVDIEGELRNILFGDDYQNDCYKSYCFEDDEEFHGDAWEDEEKIRIRNLVNAYLRDILPHYTYVLVDVTW